MSKSTSNEKKLEVIHYSIVVPVYNEEDSLKPLFAELLSVMVPLNVRYEIVFVDDCSSDNSPAIMNEFQQSLPEVVKIIRLPKRSGQTFALRKGLDASVGEVAITLDADLQNDPADIPKLLKIIEEGFDCACGWRKSRQDTPLKAGLSKFGNVLQRLFTGMTIHDVSCTLRAYKRHCVGKIALNWEGQHRFIP
ncbi:MAG: glycosyltransferase family 2 protein, partial [Candidatus Omnitrophica bacterium]|nr:glycosyltransferase family 2 protein [Candidatus Omnitrophota bacterium]